MVHAVSPIPKTSVVIDSGKLMTLDWLRWFRDIEGFILRLLNRYDSNKSGITTLVSGTVVIVNSTITANTYIRNYRQNSIGTLGHLSVVLSPGVGFTLNSSSALDNSTIFYEIVEAF